MEEETEIDYLARRAQAELALAETARDATAAHVHRQMAVAYAQRVADLRSVTTPVIEIRGPMPQPSTLMR